MARSAHTLNLTSSSTNDGHDRLGIDGEIVGYFRSLELFKLVFRRDHNHLTVDDLHIELFVDETRCPSNASDIHSLGR